MPKSSKRTRIAKIKFLILLAIIVIALLVSIYLHTHGFHFKDLKLKILSYKSLAPFIFISLYVLVSLIPAPFISFTLVAAMVFPPLDAFIYSLAGNVVFITIMFFFVRWLGRDYIEISEKKNEKLKELDMQFEENAFRDIVLLRFFFIIPAEVINLIAGLSKVKFREYFYASCFGMIPVIAVYVMFIKGFVYHHAVYLYVSILLAIILHIIPLVYVYKLRYVVKKSARKCVSWFSFEKNK